MVGASRLKYKQDFHLGTEKLCEAGKDQKQRKTSAKNYLGEFAARCL